METTPASAAKRVPGSPVAWTATRSADARCLFDRRLQLGFRVLIGRGESSISKRVCAGLVDLDEVGTLFELLPDNRNEFLRAVGVVSVGQNVLFGVIAKGILVAAENVDRISADAESRPGNPALINRVAHCRVGGARRLRFPCRVRR